MKSLIDPQPDLNIETTFKSETHPSRDHREKHMPENSWVVLIVHYVGPMVCRIYTLRLHWPGITAQFVIQALSTT